MTHSSTHALERHRTFFHRVACACLLGLIALCVVWELFAAPIRPGGSWLVLKVLPLLLVMPGVLKQRLRTFQVLSLLIWLYVAEGATRVYSDPNVLSNVLAGVEIALSMLLFAAVCAYAQTFKHKQQKECAPKKGYVASESPPPFPCRTILPAQS
ncbi:MAG: DUF2069 domain-containing protein [Limnobacter sp.]|nr:DUF2069 domain-containing protein [Limnobacter sp.]